MLEVKMIAEEKYEPVYANDTDACMDIKAKIDNDLGFIVIQPSETVKVNSGLQVDVPKNHIMQMFVRSSVGIKKNLCLANGTGIIDNGFKDEIIMALYNFGKEPQIVQDGDRICQFLIFPRPQIKPIFVQDNEGFRQGDRGGGIGSSGV
jgi:dUTP pyrophosphatase